MDLSDLIVPIPGATRVETGAVDCRARLIVLTDEDRGSSTSGSCGPRALDVRRRLRSRPPRRRRSGARHGSAWCGQEHVCRSLVAQGYHRLNRDDAGGTLTDLLPALDAALASGASRIVLDNTYVSRKSRAEVIRAARRADSRFAASGSRPRRRRADQRRRADRVALRHGCQTSGARALRKRDVGGISADGPVPLSRAARAAGRSEGFSRVDVVPFVRRPDPSFVNRAVIVWCEACSFAADPATIADHS